MKNINKLNSGITLITDKSSKTSTVTFSIYFKVGSAYESDKKAGVTALTMNMFFRRLGDYNQSELYNSMEKLGGEIKGLVSKDYTCFEFTVLSCFAPQALDLMLKFFDEIVWTQEDLEIEKKITQKKIDFYFNDYDYCLLKQTGIKSYVRNIKGTYESVEDITLIELNRWKSKYFIPSNACMVITGNFDKKIENKCKNTLNEIEFTNSPKKKFFVPSKAYNRSQEDYIIRKTDDDVGEIRLFFDVNLNNFNINEFLTAMNILGLGVGGKLPYYLKDVNALTDSVDFDVHYTESYAIIDIDLYVNSCDVKQSFEIISKSINEMKNNITKDILETGILFNTLNESKYYDTSEFLAGLYGCYDFVLNKPYSIEESVSAKEKITPESLMTLSKELFIPNNMFLCINSNLKNAVVKEYTKTLFDSLKNN